MKHFTNTFSIGFYCRPSRTSSKGGCPIQMGINLQGERYFVSLPRKADPKQFKKMMASQLPNELKDYLISIEASLFRFERDCIQNGKPFTMEAIKLFIKSGYSTQGLTFEALVEEFFRSLRLKCKAGGMTEKRFRKYEVAVAHFLEHGDIKPDMLVAEIKNQHILDFKHYMMGDSFEPGTIAGCVFAVKKGPGRITEKGST